MHRHALLTTTALSLTLISAAPALAQDIINIPAQPLSDALVELGNETGLQVLAPADAVAGKTSKAVSGPMTPEAALREMLSETDLNIRMPEENGAVLNFQDVVSQNAQDDPFDLGTLVLRGDRSLKPVEEIGSSVVVVNEETISRTPGSSTVDDIVDRVPNITSTRRDEPPVIRGIPTVGISSGAAAATGGFRPRGSFVVDGRPLSPWEYGFGGTSNYDIEQVEVYRGTQTASQGVNSIAGATFVFTKDPSFEFESGVKLEYGSRNLGRVAGYVSGPIIEDVLAFRLTGDFQKQDSFFELQ